MKTRFVALSLGIAVLAGAAATASADEVKPVGLSVRAGLFLPSDSAARDAGSSWFAFGAEFKLRDLVLKGSKNPAELSLSVDYTNKGTFRALPVTLNYTTHRGDLYFTAGAGVSFTQTDTSNTSKFAYVAGLGVDFSKGSNPVFLEVRYFGNEESRINGFGVFVGTRL